MRKSQNVDILAKNYFIVLGRHSIESVLFVQVQHLHVLEEFGYYEDLFAVHHEDLSDGAFEIVLPKSFAG